MSDELAVRAASSSDESTWNEYVRARAPSSLAHQFSWKAAFESSYGKQSHFLLAIREGSPKGILPLIHMTGPLTGNRLISLPFLDQGGYLSDDPETTTALGSACLELAERVGARGFEFRGSSPFSRDPDRETHRFRFILDLSNDEEEVWKQIGPKVRNQIRKSERSNLKTAREEDLRTFYSIFARNMHSLGSPVHSFGFFQAIADHLSSDFALFVTRDEHAEPVAAGIAIASGSMLTVPWASSAHFARSKCPNHSLYWRILRHASKAGFSQFDFGRSSVGTGTFQFKKQWRAQAEPIHWSHFDRRGQPEEGHHFDPRRNARLARIWSALPAFVADRLGPIVRQQLAN